MIDFCILAVMNILPSNLCINEFLGCPTGGGVSCQNSLEVLNLLTYKLIMSSDDEIVQFVIQILLRKKKNCEYLSVLGNAVRTRYIPKGGLKKLFLRHPDHFLLNERYVSGIYVWRYAST